MNRNKNSTKREKSTDAKEYGTELTRALVQFLHSAGLDKRKIEVAVRKAIRQLPAAKTAKKVANIDAGTASIVGAAFHRWFRSKRFMDVKGQPAPLRLLGKGKSVQSLIALEKGSVQPEIVAQELVRLGLVKRTKSGLYMPTSLHSLIRKNHPYLFEHVAHSIVRFLHTVADNANTPIGVTPLIERYAQVSAISKSKIREFRDFSSQQGEALIDTMNDWLEANRVGSGTRRMQGSAQAGLHVFAYVASRGDSHRR